MTIGELAERISAAASAGERLGMLMEFQGLSVRGAGRLLGVSAAQVDRWKKDRWSAERPSDVERQLRQDVEAGDPTVFYRIAYQRQHAAGTVAIVFTGAVNRDEAARAVRENFRYAEVIWGDRGARHSEPLTRSSNR